MKSGDTGVSQQTHR